MTTRHRAHTNTTPLKLNLHDDNLLEIFSNKNTQKEKQQSWPKVNVPPNFTVLKPRPLTITESTDLLRFVTATAGLALILFTGAFVLGWKVDTLFAPELNA